MKLRRKDRNNKLAVLAQLQHSKMCYEMPIRQICRSESDQFLEKKYFLIGFRSET
ncbi:hypothetical protein TrispH2_008314, partial [Trichoplax sp. H2]